jgi:N-methylhydantoinase A
VPKQILGIDVGGTFTDFALIEDNQLSIHKIPSSPASPEKSIITGIEELNPSKLATIAHGSTVATNALLERKGAKTALVITKGFEDIIEIGRQTRPDLFDLQQDKPDTLVKAENRFGIEERMDHKGNIVTELTDVSIKSLVKSVKNADIDGVSVSLLFSFLNPAHEQILKNALSKIEPKLYISISSEVLPEFREFERTSTVTVNSYIGPVVARYMANLTKSLGKGIRIMQSSGGSISAELASQQPVRTILSGPAGGVVGARYISSLAGFDHIITFDMGGTSTDVSLCPNRIQETTNYTIGGQPVSVPMIDIHTVGAGGGSIASMDSGGALNVGPESAGANPGPACYGSGTSTTVTDANLLLGRMHPDHFLGGKMVLDIQNSENSIAPLAQTMDVTKLQAAEGIIRVVNSNMERAIRSISLERGFDPRDFTLVPFGGAGPLHACDLAQELRIPRVLVPAYPGVLSALGIAVADVVKDYSQTVMLRGSIQKSDLEKVFNSMQEQGRAEMLDQGIIESQLQPRKMLDVRYVGQSFELTIECPDQDNGFTSKVSEAFNIEHERRFGYKDPTSAIEIVNARFKMIAQSDRYQPTAEKLSSKTPQNNALLGQNQVIFYGNRHTTTMYDRSKLLSGNTIEGPAIIFQLDSTTVIPPDWYGTLDVYKNLVLSLRNSD